MVGKVRSNLIVRSASAILLLPVVVYVVLSGIGIFYASVGLVAVLMGMEWYSIIKKLKSKFIWSLVALTYVLAFASSLFWIRRQEDGQSLLLWLLVTTWVSDTGAFVF